MKDIAAKVQGLCASISLEDSHLFKGIRYVKTRAWDGEIVTTPQIEKVCKDVPESKISRLGIGGLLWFYKNNPNVRVTLPCIEPPRGPMLEPLLIPDKILNSAKWLVDGKERWYFFEALEACFNHCNGMVKLPTGCHERGYKVLLYSGNSKLVEDVEVGDTLMGPDSLPRKVLQLCEGYSNKMYKISPIWGSDSFVCNGDHILSLKVTTGAKDKRYPDGSIINISINDYLKQTKTFKHITKLWRTGVSLPEQELEFDPYLVGCYLADGTKKGCNLTINTKDIEVLEYFKKWGEEEGFIITQNKDPRGKAVRTTISTSKKENPFRDFCKVLVTSDNRRRIPDNYLHNSRENRLQLLAGLLDCDGSLNSNCYDFIAKDECFSEQVAWLVRSLGLTTQVVSCRKGIKTAGLEGTYYRLYVSGNTSEIPCKIKRKKATPRGQVKDNLVTGFHISELPGDTYYGFTLDKDHLYLSNDFTVLHNSGKTEIELTLAYNQALNLGPGVIIVPTLAIKEQFVGRAKSYKLLEVVDYEELRNAEYIADTQIIITTPGVLLNDIKAESNSIFNKIRWIIGDECHHAGCNTWYDIFIALPNATRAHGFSALPVLPSTDWAQEFADLDIEDARTIAVMGPIIYQKSAKELKDFLNIPYLINFSYHWKEGYSGNDPHELKKLVKANQDRNKFLADVISFTISKGYKSITFVSVKEHGKNILKEVNDNRSVAWFGGGKFITNSKEKLTSKECRAKFGNEYLNIIATSHAVEGLDLDDPLNFLLVHEERKVRRTLQRVGRVVRPDKAPAMIVNVVDRGVGILTNQAECRELGIIEEFDCEVYNVSSLLELTEVLHVIEVKYENKQRVNKTS